MRTPLIAGNWKMNTTLADAHVLANGVKTHAEHLEHIEIVLCPPSIWLTEVAHMIPSGHFRNLKVGAQNMYCADSGAFTGEISPVMVKSVAEYVIIGHSERTHIFGEKLPLLVNKMRAAFDHGLTPILCIGEDTKGSESKRHLVHLLNHLLVEASVAEIERLVVAYEPVWAIGSGTPAAPDYAEEVAATLRQVLTAKTRILYGGSVSDENAPLFLRQPNIDGLLVGGMSLTLKPFLSICKMADDAVISHKTKQRL